MREVDTRPRAGTKDPQRVIANSPSPHRSDRLVRPVHNHILLNASAWPSPETGAAHSFPTLTRDPPSPAGFDTTPPFWDPPALDAACRTRHPPIVTREYRVLEVDVFSERVNEADDRRERLATFMSG